MALSQKPSSNRWPIDLVSVWEPLGGARLVCYVLEHIEFWHCLAFNIGILSFYTLALQAESNNILEVSSFFQAKVFAIKGPFAGFRGDLFEEYDRSGT